MNCKKKDKNPTLFKIECGDISIQKRNNLDKKIHGKNHEREGGFAMKKRVLTFVAAMLMTAIAAGCGGKEEPKQEVVQEEVVQETTEEAIAEPVEDRDMMELISRFQGDWNGAMMFIDCTGKYEYLQDEWTSCLARFVIDEAGNINPFLGVHVEDTPFTNLQAWLDTDMECMMLNGEWIATPFYETRITEYQGTLNLEVYIENSMGSLCMFMNMRHVGDEGWTDEYPGLSPENLAYCRGMSFDELAAINGYAPGDYPETANDAGGSAASSVSAVDLGEKEGADGQVELAVLKELLPWMKFDTDYGMPYEEIAAKFGVHGKYVDTFESNGEQFVRYRWSADDDNRITITFYANADGTETWNVTTWDGLKD